MIFSPIESHDAFEIYPDATKKALDHLTSHDFATTEPGVYEIQGKEIYAQVFNIVIIELDAKKAESHEKYLDVQYLVSGKERPGFIKNAEDYQTAEHIKEHDLIFYQSVGDKG